MKWKAAILGFIIVAHGQILFGCGQLVEDISKIVADETTEEQLHKHANRQKNPYFKVKETLGSGDIIVRTLDVDLNSGITKIKGDTFFGFICFDAKEVRTPAKGTAGPIINRCSFRTGIRPSTTGGFLFEGVVEQVNQTCGPVENPDTPDTFIYPKYPASCDVMAFHTGMIGNMVSDWLMARDAVLKKQGAVTGAHAFFSPDSVFLLAKQ